ncbi:hypothetical protein BZB76_6362 [Actinomadura pelletieri DSM 43383]|uniref:Uncharacterized protein n=1 Tax=Actinomadura pelletieri DSM 43383 TaxID=1120940 RepID=A0A495Q9F3_9ACTN|nr:hypothetical protein [Actinomadura pelletieri]RKS68118.1 hypothetical protein BZB76_6362 [Actinomadura pelletieri DSM 43383]
MATAYSAPSTETQEEIAAALQQIIAQLGSSEMKYPAELVNASLARDGAVRVIAYLADLAATAAREASAASGQDPEDLVRRFVERIDPGELPGTVLAWKRAVDAVLHLLGAPFPKVGVGSVEPEDLATALIFLQLLSRTDLGVGKHDPGLICTIPATTRRATGGPTPGPTPS